MLRSQWQDDPRAVALLAREALVGRTIRHPHVVSVLAANVGAPPRFVVTPWLDGCTLRAHAGAQPLDLPEALWFVRQAAEGLAALHAAGWMHGDIKPSNLFVARDGHVTLLDLGFARSRNESGSAFDRCVAGTCGYLAPEWITSALRADIRSDIYSLGVVLFELLIGRLPFRAKDLAELAVEQRVAIPPNLIDHDPPLPVAVTRLVQRMLAKDPLRRPQVPGDLAGELAALEVATFAQRRAIPGRVEVPFFRR
jgi:serine/threonine-protein kinase